MIGPGDAAPDFELAGTAGTVRLSSLSAGVKVVLAFYAEDATPTCSAQVSALKADHDLIQELGARVIAISADSVESHRAFAERLGGVPFDLVSDEALTAARAYGVVDEAGKRSRRAVFVVEDGTVRLALPWFNPANSSQYEEIFRALM